MINNYFSRYMREPAPKKDEPIEYRPEGKPMSAHSAESKPLIVEFGSGFTLTHEPIDPKPLSVEEYKALREHYRVQIQSMVDDAIQGEISALFGPVTNKCLGCRFYSGNGHRAGSAKFFCMPHPNGPSEDGDCKDFEAKAENARAFRPSRGYAPISAARFTYTSCAQAQCEAETPLIEEHPETYAEACARSEKTRKGKPCLSASYIPVGRKCYIDVLEEKTQVSNETT